MKERVRLGERVMRMRYWEVDGDPVAGRSPTNWVNVFFLRSDKGRSVYGVQKRVM